VEEVASVIATADVTPATYWSGTSSSYWPARRRRQRYGQPGKWAAREAGALRQARHNAASRWVVLAAGRECGVRRCDMPGR
jgi:hypothetical protein